MKINTMFGTICIGCYTANTVGLTSSLTLPASSFGPASSVGSYGGMGLGLTGLDFPGLDFMNIVIPDIPGIRIAVDPPAPTGLQQLDYIVASRIFTFTAINLKPSTQHTWIFASQTGSVTTDAQGSVTFNVTFNPGSGTYSTLSAALSTINGMTGGMVMSLSTADNISSATCTVTLVPGGDAPVTNPTAPIIPRNTGGPSGLGYSGVGTGGRISCGVQRCGSAYN